MNFDDERIAIEKHLIDKWALTSYASSVNIYPENAKVNSTAIPFIQIYIVNTDSNQVELGSALTPAVHRLDGFVDFMINTEIYSATTLSRKLADAVSAIFNRQKISYGSSGSIIFMAGTRKSLGPSDGAYQEALRMPFRRTVRV